MKKQFRQHTRCAHLSSNLNERKKKHSTRERSSSQKEHSIDVLFSKLISATSLIPFIDLPDEDFRQTCIKRFTKRRNRFQNFFYRLSLKIERACSSIENRKVQLRASGNDFT